MDKIQEKLTQLEELDAQYEIIRLDKEAAINQILTDEIKLAVLAHGETVKANKYKAIFGKGRVSWDSKGLAGFAVAHPVPVEF